MNYGIMSILVAAIVIMLGLLLFLIYINREDENSQKKRDKNKDKVKRVSTDKSSEIKSIGELRYKPDVSCTTENFYSSLYPEVRGLSGSVAAPYSTSLDAKIENAKLAESSDMTRKADKCIKLALLSGKASNVQEVASKYLHELTEKEVDLRIRNKQGCYRKHHINMDLPDGSTDDACYGALL